MIRTLVLSLTLAVSAILQGQVVLEPPTTIKLGSKAACSCLALSPKGDRLLVGTLKGAELVDIRSGKRVFSFAYEEDGSGSVYHCAFNDNGEFVVLIGATGKRQVWSAASGKRETNITVHRWVPDAVRIREMGLSLKNSLFDRFYLQGEAKHGDRSVRADRNGTIIFADDEGRAVQTLKYAENKDQHHRAPLLFADDLFFTGTDDGRVLIYGLVAR